MNLNLIITDAQQTMLSQRNAQSNIDPKTRPADDVFAASVITDQLDRMVSQTTQQAADAAITKLSEVSDQLQPSDIQAINSLTAGKSVTVAPSPAAVAQPLTP